MTRASDTAKLLGAGATILDGTTISTADNTAQLTLTSTDADASRGPILDLYRNSSSPADNDIAGTIQINARNDNSQDFQVAEINFQAIDVSDGTEDGRMNFSTMLNGTSRARITVSPTETAFNEDSQNLDFRVESDGNANMLFVDAGNNMVGIGTNAPHDLFSVKGVSGATTDISFSGGDDTNDIRLFLGGDSNPFNGQIIYEPDNNVFKFATSGSERMRVGSNILIGTTDNSPAESSSATGTRLGTNGGTQISTSGIEILRLNRNSDDGVLVTFCQGGDVEGQITVSGSTVTYGGGHLGRWSRLPDNSKDTSIVKGTVMSNLDEMIEWKHEKELWTKDDELPDGVSIGDVKKSAYTEDNEQLNKMAVSSVEGDANVSGVFVSWDDDDDFKDMMIAMTGDMVIRIAKDTTVSRGDLLMSAGDGTAKPQGDDIVRSKTIAKVTSTNKSHTYDDGTYLVPCVLMAC